jgi:hypothetical protein
MASLVVLQAVMANGSSTLGCLELAGGVGGCVQWLLSSPGDEWLIVHPMSSELNLRMTANGFASI